MAAERTLPVSPARGRKGRGRSRALAAIDCGTNSTRLLVADGNGVAVERLMRITRLGQGVDSTHRLADDAIERTVSVLAEFKKVLDDAGVRRVRAVATSAVRDADNAEAFLRAAHDVLGVEPEILDGVEEGALAYAGATADLPQAAGDDVVVDIGGGSTELIVRRDGSLGVTSLDIGCVRLTERTLRRDPPSSEEAEAAVAIIDAALDQALAAVPALGDLRAGSRLIGLAGTVSTLAMLDQQCETYDRDRVHLARLTRGTVERWCDVLLAEPAADRRRRPGMVDGREDVIAAGALVLREVMRRFGFDECLVSESDILDGIVASLRSAGTASRAPRDAAPPRTSGIPSGDAAPSDASEGERGGVTSSALENAPMTSDNTSESPPPAHAARAAALSPQEAALSPREKDKDRLIEEQRSEIDLLRARVAIAVSQRDHEASARERAELHSRVAEAQLNTLLHSRAWRVAGTLRWASERLRKLAGS